MSHPGDRWLAKWVRVGAACQPSTTLAEGAVIGYASAPTIVVRDEQGRDTTWQVTLPIGVLGEVSDADLDRLSKLRWAIRPSVDTAGRIEGEPEPEDSSLEVLRGLADGGDRIAARALTKLEPGPGDTDEALVVALDDLIDRADRAGWVEPEKVVELLGFTGREEMPGGVWVRARLAERIRPTTVERQTVGDAEMRRRTPMSPMPEPEETPVEIANEVHALIEGTEPEVGRMLGWAVLDEILREAGIEYPLGLRGVADLVNQRDGHLEAAREAEQVTAMLTEDRDRVLKANAKQAGMIHERDAKLRAVNERAEEAERRLANVREMVGRLRNAAGAGVTPGYIFARIEHMLNGEKPA